MKVLVINSGSSSIKYEIFDAEGCVKLASGLIERIGSGEGRLRQRLMRKDKCADERSVTVNVPDHRAGFELMEKVNREAGIIRDGAELLGIGHRVVHGGELFRDPALVDDRLIAAVRELIPLAPLHNPSNLLGIEIMRQRYPSVAQVAVFDTAFHQTLPPRAYRYAVPQELYEQYQVRKYGFHGTSHANVGKEAARHLGRPFRDVNLIILHLGNGASAAAVRGGKSIDTSLGLTPLEGLMMGTRCGDIDPSLPFYLMRRAGMRADEVEELLNRESGLRGICGASDMREVQDRAGRGDEQALLAIEMFCYRIKKYIGAYHAVLGRVDAVVFTGGIGENAPAVRQQSCEGLGHLGIAIDPLRNARVSDGVTEVQKDGRGVKVLVIRTNEEREIAVQTIETVRSSAGRTWA